MTVDLFDKKRGVLQVSGNDSVGNMAEFTLQQNGELHVSLENPWAGDTESGFGQTCYLDIPKDGVEALRKLLKVQ